MARPIKVAGSQHPYARLVVPKDVRSALGRTEWRQPLRGTEKERVALHGQLVAGWKREIEIARARLKGEVVSFTAREVQTLCADWYRAQTTEFRDDDGTATHWDLWVDYYRDMFEPAHPGAEVDDFIPVSGILDEVEARLAQQGFAVDRATRRRFAEAWARRQIQFGQVMCRRAAGDWSEDPVLRQLPKAETPPPKLPKDPPASGKLTFTDILEGYAADRPSAPKTVAKRVAMFIRFAAMIGHDDPSRVTKDDIRRWKEYRRAEGVLHKNKPSTPASAKTIDHDVGAMRAVFQWALDNGLWTGENVAARMGVRKAAGDSVEIQPYTDAEARHILEAARGETGLRRWLPWVLCFTGARIAEVTGAFRDDIRQEAGVWILDIHPKQSSSGRGLKTLTSQRLVPLHPALIAEGFLDYVATRPAGSPLFARDGSDVADDGEGAASKHRRWVRTKAGITDPRKAPAHSWRHRLEDELRRVRALPEVTDALAGHSNPRNAGAGYGVGFRRMPDEVLKDLQRVPSPLA